MLGQGTQHVRPACKTLVHSMLCLSSIHALLVTSRSCRTNKHGRPCDSQSWRNHRRLKIHSQASACTCMGSKPSLIPIFAISGLVAAAVPVVSCSFTLFTQPCPCLLSHGKHRQVSCKLVIVLSMHLSSTQANSNQRSKVLVQVVNRDRLQRAGEDNLFVRLLYAKDKPQIPKTLDEQEKLGMPSVL